MRDFGNGWSGLKDFAISRGVATVDDTDDAVAAKCIAVIQGTLPEEEQAAPAAPMVFEEEDNGEVSSDSESEAEA